MRHETFADDDATYCEEERQICGIQHPTSSTILTVHHSLDSSMLVPALGPAHVLMLMIKKEGSQLNP